MTAKPVAGSATFNVQRLDDGRRIEARPPARRRVLESEVVQAARGE